MKTLKVKNLTIEYTEVQRVKKLKNNFLVRFLKGRKKYGIQLKLMFKEEDRNVFNQQMFNYENEQLRDLGYDDIMAQVKKNEEEGL